MRAKFADPKTDFVFKRIFGTAAHKDLLIELLNALLELDGDQRIVDLTHLPPEQKVPVDELKKSLVDVKCVDQAGRQYVVEMQVLNVEGFEKRIVYNTAKAYVSQLRTGDGYPELDDVVGVTICDFILWPVEQGLEPRPHDQPVVPMLSRWRMQEQHSGVRGLAQVQYVFMELPKYAAGDSPTAVTDKWAYFFRETKNLTSIPPALIETPFAQALEVARLANFSLQELDLYDSAKVAEQDARGALTYAEARGEARGLAQGLRLGIRALCAALEIAVDAEREAQLESLSATELNTLQDRLLREHKWV